MKLKTSRISFIRNYIVGVGILVFILFSDFPTWMNYALFFFSMLFFLEPEATIVYRTYSIESDRISEVEGILSKKRTAIPCSNIASTTMKKGIIGRILDFGDIIITGFTGMELKFRGMKNPVKYLKIIEKRIERHKK